MAVSNPGNGQALVYNTSEGKWKNTTLAISSISGLQAALDSKQASGNYVTSVKVGSTSYAPSSGVVSLPAYPTSLPASDVYAWAKAATKPSYTLDEVADGSNRKLSNYLYGTVNKNIIIRATDNSNTWGAIGYTDGENTAYNLRVIRFGGSPGASFGGSLSAYGSGIMFGGADTRAYMMVRYASGHVEFGGGSVAASTAASIAPSWHFGINGTDGVNYDLPTIASNASNGNTAYNSLGNYVLKAGDTMTGNLTMGTNAVIFNMSSSSSWASTQNSGLRILNSASTSGTAAGAPNNYSVGLSVSGYYGFQIASYGGGANRFYLRNTRDGSETAGDWVSIWHSGNSNKYDVAWTCSQLNTAGIIDMNRNASTGAIYDSTKQALEIETYASDIKFKMYNTSGTNIGTGLCFYNSGNTVNVGIGTNTPAYKLHVDGDSNITGWIRFGNGQNLQSVDTSGYAAQLVSFDANNVAHFGYGSSAGVYQTRIYGNPLYILNNNRQIMTSVSNTGKFVLGANIKSGVSDSGDHAALFEAWVNSTDVKYIASLCNARNNATAGYGVGIKFKFSSGDDGLNKYLGLAAVASSAYGNGRDFVFYNYTTELARITGTGNFSITGTSGWTGNFISSNNIAYLAHASANSGGLYIGTKANTSSGYALRVYYNQTTLASGGSCALAVRADGNVGIGVASPTRKLSVDGTIGAINELEIREESTQDRFFTKVLPYGLSIFNNQSKFTSGWNAQIAAGTNGTNAGIIAGAYFTGGNTFKYYWYGGTTYTAPGIAILANGNVGIGTVNPSYKLHVAGTIVSTGDQVVSSDASLKTNFSKINYSVSDIAACRAVTFDWRDGRGRSAGSIAQDWKPLIPELVHGEEGGMTLAYGQIALVNSIIIARHETEQDKEIKRLKARVEELEKQLKIRS